MRLFENLRYEINTTTQGDGWNRQMLCIDEMVSELENDGWLVNQSRMWLASHWTVRNDKSWLLGQERMHQNLIDGSRAANLLGWQWTAGAGTGKAYGFALTFKTVQTVSTHSFTNITFLPLRKD